MAERASVVEMETADNDDPAAAFDDVELALTGMYMLLNNKFDEAQALFQKHKDESALMHAGFSFVYFMQALMSFEEEKLDDALKVLQETEKACDNDSGVFKSLRKKFKSKKKLQNEEQYSVEEKIQRNIVVGDSLLYQAILVMTNQDIPSYIKGGWYMRKAYKIYDKLHKEVKQLQAKNEQRRSNVSQGTTNGPTDGNENILPEEVVARLMGAVNFGYGTFQLCISMVPPKILKLIEFLGFEGDREEGLQSLEYTSHSKDMKAPLATLGLLWYHTVLRPFFALDGANNCSAGTDDAERIIEEKEKDFMHSSLFLFFRGRIFKLRKNTDEALVIYQQALTEAAGQREIELMCLYEIGWCNLMKMNYSESLQAFTRLKEETKWSKCYYTYLMGVCLGAMGNIDEAASVLRQVPGLLKKKNNQIEAYASRRAEKCKKVKFSQEYCRLLTLELAFLWHALPTCTPSELQPYLNICDMQTDNKVFHLKCLLEGAVFKELGEEEMAIQCLDEALARHQGMKEDAHVPPFAHFELASIYMKKPETVEKAKHMLQKIKDSYKDYDFENRLVVRVNNALRDLKKKGLTSSH